MTKKKRKICRFYGYTVKAIGNIRIGFPCIIDASVTTRKKNRFFFIDLNWSLVGKFTIVHFIIWTIYLKLLTLFLSFFFHFFFFSEHSSLFFVEENDRHLNFHTFSNRIHLMLNCQFNCGQFELVFLFISFWFDNSVVWK